MNASKIEPVAPDPHHYAVAAQMIAAHVEQLRGLYVSVRPSHIEVQGDPTLPVQQQLDALRRLARYLGAPVSASEPRTTRSWAENYTYRSYDVNAEYDGVRVHGFVHDRTDIGRIDEVPNLATVTVFPGGAA